LSARLKGFSVSTVADFVALFATRAFGFDTGVFRAIVILSEAKDLRTILGDIAAASNDNRSQQGFS
jgi:hypothetical protein